MGNEISEPLKKGGYPNSNINSLKTDCSKEETIEMKFLDGTEYEQPEQEKEISLSKKEIEKYLRDDLKGPIPFTNPLYKKCNQAEILEMLECFLDQSVYHTNKLDVNSLIVVFCKSTLQPLMGFYREKYSHGFEFNGYGNYSNLHVKTYPLFEKEMPLVSMGCGNLHDLVKIILGIIPPVDNNSIIKKIVDTELSMDVISNINRILKRQAANRVVEFTMLNCGIELAERYLSRDIQIMYIHGPYVCTDVSSEEKKKVKVKSLWTLLENIFWENIHSGKMEFVVNDEDCTIDTINSFCREKDLENKLEELEGGAGVKVIL